MITFEQRYGIRYVHADGTPFQPDVQADIDAALAAAHRRGWDEALALAADTLRDVYGEAALAKRVGRLPYPESK